MHALGPGSQRVLDDQERQRARERGMEADRKMKGRTLIPLQERPQSSGAMLKQATVVRTAMPPSASAPGVPYLLSTPGCRGNLVRQGQSTPGAAVESFPLMPSALVAHKRYLKAAVQGGDIQARQGSQAGTRGRKTLFVLRVHPGMHIPGQAVSRPGSVLVLRRAHTPRCSAAAWRSGQCWLASLWC